MFFLLKGLDFEVCEKVKSMLPKDLLVFIKHCSVGGEHLLKNTIGQNQLNALDELKTVATTIVLQDNNNPIHIETREYVINITDLTPIQIADEVINYVYANF